MKFLKVTYLIILLIFLALTACHKHPTTILPIAGGSDSTCSNQVWAALITPGDLNAIISGSGFKKIYMQFKTTDDKHFYPAAYSDNNIIPFADESSKIIPFGLASPLLPAKPYIFGNLEWKFSTGFTPNMSLQYYCLLPAMDADGMHVTYTYIEVPSSFHYNDSTYSVDTAFVAHSDKQRLDSLKSYAIKVVTGSGASLNPCPPNKPSN